MDRGTAGEQMGVIISDDEPKSTSSTQKFFASDFGYSYVPTTDTADLPAATQVIIEGADREDDPSQPFKNVTYDYTGGESRKDIDAEVLAPVSVFTCCCCLSFVLLIVGAFLYRYDEVKTIGGAEVAGAVLLAVGVFMFLIGFLLCCAACVLSCSKGIDLKNGKKHWSLKRMNDRFEDELDAIDDLRFPVGEGSTAMQKAKRAETIKEKEREKAKRASAESLLSQELSAGLSLKELQRKHRPVVFRIIFDGDVNVSTIDTLREQISLCIIAGSKYDTVCVVVTSGGGMVTMYGLAAAQLGRVRKAGMQLVVCVDSIAASGGYLMATMANRILASPFALVGSIGVISIVPNVQKLLEKHNINTYVFTAGKYKRTVDVVGEVTDEGKAKMVEELEGIHQVFRDHICVNRPALRGKIDEVSTGEVWLAIEGKEKGLVDEIMTSDEYFLEVAKTHDVINVKPKSKSKLLEELFDSSLTSKARSFFSKSMFPESRREAMMLN